MGVWRCVLGVCMCVGLCWYGHVVGVQKTKESSAGSVPMRLPSQPPKSPGPELGKELLILMLLCPHVHVLELPVPQNTCAVLCVMGHAHLRIVSCTDLFQGQAVRICWAMHMHCLCMCDEP